MLVVTHGVIFGSLPQNVQCPDCGHHVRTVIRYTPGCCAYVLCGVLILLGCWLGCCLIPFCVEGCQDVEHYCPLCNALVGKYERGC